jgi:hypothetical protein
MAAAIVGGRQLPITLLLLRCDGSIGALSVALLHVAVIA